MLKKSHLNFCVLGPESHNQKMFSISVPDRDAKRDEWRICLRQEKVTSPIWNPKPGHHLQKNLDKGKNISFDLKDSKGLWKSDWIESRLIEASANKLF